MGKANIKLEIITKSDRSEYFRLIDKNRDNLRVFLDWVDATRCENDLDKFLDDNEKRLREKTGCIFKILEDDAIIGTIGFFQNGESKTVFEIGYWLDRDRRRQGIISSLVPIIEKTCFDGYNAEKVEIWCAMKNIGSNKVALRNNYTLERIIEKHKTLCGVVLDYNIYCKFKPDYEQPHINGLKQQST